MNWLISTNSIFCFTIELLLGTYLNVGSYCNGDGSSVYMMKDIWLLCRFSLQVIICLLYVEDIDLFCFHFCRLLVLCPLRLVSLVTIRWIFWHFCSCNFGYLNVDLFSSSHLQAFFGLFNSSCLRILSLSLLSLS